MGVVYIPLDAQARLHDSLLTSTAHLLCLYVRVVAVYNNICVFDHLISILVSNYHCTAITTNISSSYDICVRKFSA